MSRQEFNCSYTAHTHNTLLPSPFFLFHSPKSHPKVEFALMLCLSLSFCVCVVGAIKLAQIDSCTQIRAENNKRLRLTHTREISTFYQSFATSFSCFKRAQLISRHTHTILTLSPSLSLLLLQTFASIFSAQN